MYLTIRTTYTVDISLYIKLDINQGENNGGVDLDIDHRYRLRYVGFSSNDKASVSKNGMQNCH